jgi:hypothetical protein
VAHLPVNHKLRPLYRTVAFACGVYVLVFGIVALTRTADLDPFARDGLPWVLGLRANGAFAALSVAAGLAVVLAALVGRNVDRWVNLVTGAVFLVAGMLMLIVLRTELNLLGFTVTTCVVSFIIGLSLSLAGLYGQVGPREAELREELFRHGMAGDPERHPLGAENVPRSAS